MSTLRDLLPQNFSQSTTAYTLAISTKVPNESGALQDLHVILGRIQSFAPSQTKTLEKIFEINTASGGEAVDIVPGGISGDEVSIDRINIYPVPFLNAFGGLEANNLRSQNFPFTIQEIIFDPKDFKRSMVIDYVNCYLADMSDPIDIADGGGGPITVSGTAQISFRRARPLFGGSASTLNPEEARNQRTKDWLSFTQTPGRGSEDQGIPKQRLLDRGIGNVDFTILDRSTLASLANVCAR